MNDRGEFLRDFLRHESDLRAMICSLVRDWHAADDVLQEVALTAWQRYDDYDSARPFGAWLRGIAVNKILRRREQTARFPVLFSPETIEAVAEAFNRAEGSAPSRMEELEPCLEKLPEKSRQLLALRYGEALDIGQVAQRMQSTPDAIYKALLRLRERLRECVQNRLAITEGRA